MHPCALRPCAPRPCAPAPLCPCTPAPLYPQELFVPLYAGTHALLYTGPSEGWACTHARNQTRKAETVDMQAGMACRPPRVCEPWQHREPAVSKEILFGHSCIPFQNFCASLRPYAAVNLCSCRCRAWRRRRCSQNGPTPNGRQAHSSASFDPAAQARNFHEHRHPAGTHHSHRPDQAPPCLLCFPTHRYPYAT